MRRFFLAVALLAVSTSASATSLSFATGVAPWQVNGNPTVAESPLGPGFVANSGGVWVGPTASSASPGSVPGLYTFTLNVGAYAGGPGNFSVDYAAAQEVRWGITNGSLGGTTSCSQNCENSFRRLTGTFAGNSVLQASVTNLGANPALAVDDELMVPLGLIVRDAPEVFVPEPSMLALLAAAAFGLARRFRQ